MADLGFHARLERIQSGEAIPASQFLPDEPAKTRRERVKRAIHVLEAAGIPRSHSYPPFYAVLAGLRLAPRPYHYQSFPTLVMVYFAALTLIFGAVHVSGVLAFFDNGPLAYFHDGGWPLIFGVSAVAGFLGAFRIRQQTASKRLPKWSDL